MTYYKDLLIRYYEGLWQADKGIPFHLGHGKDEISALEAIRAGRYWKMNRPLGVLFCDGGTERKCLENACAGRTRLEYTTDAWRLAIIYMDSQELALH